MSDKINVRGVHFDNVNFDEAMEKVKELVASEGVSVMYTPNSEIVRLVLKITSFTKLSTVPTLLFLTELALYMLPRFSVHP